MTPGPAPERAAGPAAAKPAAAKPAVAKPATASGAAASPARTVFFGSGGFAVPILQAIATDPRLAVVGVVTAPDRRAGRGGTLRPTPVALQARSMWVPLLQPARVRAPEAVAEIEALEPELGVLADYGQIVPRALLDLPRHGILNVHPSLLPRHRGATPIPATIAAGDEQAGVTIIRMDAGVDTGPIVAQEGWPLDGTERAPELEARAAGVGSQLLARTLEAWLAGAISARPQETDGATTTRPFRRADARLDPDSSAAELERRVRANTPWPGTFVETPDGRMAIHRASVAGDQAGDETGALVQHGDRLALATTDGRLVLDEVQLAGKRSMTGPEFLRGHERLVGVNVASSTATSAPVEAPAR